MLKKFTSFAVFLFMLTLLMTVSCSSNPGDDGNGSQSGKSPLGDTALQVQSVTNGSYVWGLSFDTIALSTEISVTALGIFKDKLFTGHWEGGNVYAFDGQTWDYSATNLVYVGINPALQQFQVYNDGQGDALYAADYSGAYGGRGGLFRYNGTSSWQIVTGVPFDAGGGGTYYGMISLASYQGKLFMGTLYRSGAYPAFVHVYEPSSGWSTAYSNTNIYFFNRMIAFNDGSGEKLHVAALSLNYDVQTFVYNGYSWDGPFTVTTDKNYPVQSFCVFRGRLYATSGYNVYVLNGNSWVSVYNAYPYSPTGMSVWNEKLYVASKGMIFEHGGDDPAANWSQAVNINSLGAYSVNTLATFQNKLYFGVQFNRFNLWPYARVYEIKNLNQPGIPKKIALRSAANGKYLRAGDYWIYADANVMLGDLSTVWHLADLRDGTYAIRGMAGGKQGFIFSDSGDSCFLQYWPVGYGISNLGNGTVAIKSGPWSTYLSVGSDGNQELAPIDGSIGIGETFYIEDATGVYDYPAYLRLPEVVTFKSVFTSHYVTKSNSSLVFSATTNGTNEKFYALDLCDGLYAFRSVLTNVYNDLWYKGGGTDIFLMNMYGQIGSYHLYFVTNLGDGNIALRNIASRTYWNQNKFARFPDGGNNLQAVSTNIGERETFQFLETTY